MKNLSKLSWFLGARFECNKDLVLLSQKHYVEKIQCG